MVLGLIGDVSYEFCTKEAFIDNFGGMKIRDAKWIISKNSYEKFIQEVVSLDEQASLKSKNISILNLDAYLDAVGR